MSVRTAQSITTVFTTTRFDTGAATTADTLPTGVLYVNGVANAATVTVTNITTGVYEAQVTLPTLAIGDICSLVITATVNSVTGKGKVWEDTQDILLDGSGDVTVSALANGVITAASIATAALAGKGDWSTTTPPTTAAIADKILGRSLATGADGGHTVQDALRFLRNHWNRNGATLTVYQEDGVTVAWTSTITTSSNTNPVTDSTG